MLLVWGVNAQPFQGSTKFRLGMNAGINMTSIGGTELKNPNPKVSMVLGAYYRYKMGKNLHLGTELNASFRGSAFDNGISDAYNLIKFIYVDAPINLMVNTSGKSENKFLTLGVEPAYLLKSEIYVKPNNIKPRYRDYGFKSFDVAAVLGYHFDFYYFGLRPSVRLGLLNINDNLYMEDVLPATGNNGTIKNLTFDVKLYF